MVWERLAFEILLVLLLGFVPPALIVWAIVALFGQPPSIRPTHRFLTRLSESSGGRFEGGKNGVLAVGTVADQDVVFSSPSGVLPQVWLPNCHPPSALVLQREGTFESTDLQTADPRFDELYRIAGPEPLLVAILNRQLRARLVALTVADVRLDVDAGEVRFHRGWGDGSPELLGRLAADAVAIGEALCLRAADVNERLASTVVDSVEPAPWRHRALTLLLQRDPRGARTAEVVESLLRSPTASFKLAAARQLRSPEGPLRDAIIAMAHNPLEDLATRCAAAHALGRSGDPAVRPALELCLAADEPTRLQEAATQALAEIALAAGTQGGGLALAPEGAGGELAEVADAGALSEAPHPPKQAQN